MIDVVNGPFGGPQWHHWVHVPSLLGLLILPAMVAAFALAVSIGRAAAAGSRRWRHPPDREDTIAVGPSVAARPVLASEADREGAVRVVTHAVGEARLSLEEGTERIDQIWQSRHRHELAGLVSDLPVPAPVPPRRGHSGVAASIVLAVVAAVVQGIFGLWELWPVAVIISVLTATVRR